MRGPVKLLQLWRVDVDPEEFEGIFEEADVMHDGQLNKMELHLKCDERHFLMELRSWIFHHFAWRFGS